MRSIYLDHAATTPLDPEVLSAMLPVFEEVHGNASSIHAFGRRAKNILEEGRESIASALGVKHDELFFTSGGTESDNYAISGVFEAKASERETSVAVSEIEHHAVLESAERIAGRGGKAIRIRVDSAGVVDLEAVQSAVRNRPVIVSVMHANNETGVVQPLQEVSRLLTDGESLFHTDAVQSFGKISLNPGEISADLVSLSAHKLYGPKGIGALVVRKGTSLAPQIVGGAQEGKRRAGTQNVPLVAGFAKAVEIATARMDADGRNLGDLRDSLEAKLRDRFPGILVNGRETERLPHILSVSFPWELFHLDGESLIMGMDLRGVAVTSGSACTSGTLQPSHVLRAMGLDEKTARATIRFSFGRRNTPEDVAYAVGALEEVVQSASISSRDVSSAPVMKGGGLS